MDKTIIMGMTFNAGSEPDFGSIYRSRERQNNVHEYGLNSSDASKLSLITNAAPGSTALCDDTGDLYRLTKSGWAKFGTASDPAESVSLSFSPLGFILSTGETLDVLPTHIGITEEIPTEGNV